jgi:hypothetical protein
MTINDEDAKDEVRKRSAALGEAIAKAAKDADFQRFQESGLIDLDYLVFRMIRYGMGSEPHHTARAGYLMTHAKVAVAMLAMETSRNMAAYVAVRAIYPARVRHVATFVIPFLMVGGLLMTLETWPPLIMRGVRYLFG